ncbi:hypothetical protein, partial [Ralstonia pseudosolanacearum]|uniref:hypothetical protein n=1 Tax=Ralstonia pseudosolanacearum TaxID=1310165 RepID=UPI002006161D
DIRQIAWVPLGLATQLRLAFSMFFFPHPAFTPQRRGIFKRALTESVRDALETLASANVLPGCYSRR